MKILFAGGGTGGHIYPLLAVAEKLKKSAVQKNIEIDLTYLGAAGDYGRVLIDNGISISKIFSAKIRRYFDLKNFLDIPLFFISLIQAFWKIFWIMPDVLFSKGGPGSLPAVLACKFYRIPVIIHESDAAPGVANLMASRFADRIGVSFEKTAEIILQKNKKIPAEKIALTGNPIRESLTKEDFEETKADAKAKLEFSSEKPLILVIGGSQGSEKINDFMLNIAPELMEENVQVIHQTGAGNFENVKKELNVSLENYTDKEMESYKIFPYLEKNLRDAYIAADAVVSRAGSGSIFEIAAFGKPAILIPLANSAQNHQVVNAYEYAKNGAAVVIEEANLKPNIFIAQFKNIISNPQKIASMSEAAKNFSKPEAAGIIAEEIIKLAGGGKTL